MRGRELSHIRAEDVAGIRLVISDVDDTITTRGRLHVGALQSLYELEDGGKRTILLSGGSAGWCETYLRQWPVLMVIAESGAVLIHRDGDGAVHYVKNPAITEGDLGKRERLLRMIGPEKLSSDQYARLYDIAVDLSLVTAGELDDIKEMATGMGACMAQSSIHLNIWFGDYSKLKGLLSFMSIAGIGPDELKEGAAYIGDALNDEELFDFFPLSFGTASVAHNRASFSHLPAFICRSEGGEGFSEAASAILRRL